MIIDHASQLAADDDVDLASDANDDWNEPTIVQHEPMAISTLIAKIN